MKQIYHVKLFFHSKHEDVEKKVYNVLSTSVHRNAYGASKSKVWQTDGQTDDRQTYA